MSVGAGADRGLMWLPEVNDEVLVGFANGDMNFPYVLGNLWNGTDQPPVAQSEAAPDGSVEVRVLQTRQGHFLKFTDKSGSEAIEMTDKAKANFIRSTSRTDDFDQGGKDIPVAEQERSR